MVNATNTTYLYNSAVDTFFQPLYLRLLEILKAPLLHREMIWIIIPLVITLVLMEFYFGRYSKEQSGWDTAIANSLVLIFVSLDLLRHLYGETSFFGVIKETPVLGLPVKTIVALAIGAYGFTLLFFDFFHWLPKRFAFIISSTLPINLIAYISIVIVYADLPVDSLTLTASILLLAGLIAVFAIIHWVEPKKREEREVYEPPEKEYEEGEYPNHSPYAESRYYEEERRP